MKTFITPEEVVNLAFCDGEFISADTISASDILTAQRRYIRPLLGIELYQRLQSEMVDSTLISSYIAPALAIGTRIIVQPSLSIRTGQFGVSATKTAYSQPATNTEISLLMKSQRIKLRTHLSCIREYLEASRDLYPEYKSAKGTKFGPHQTTSGIVM